MPPQFASQLGSMGPDAGSSSPSKQCQTPFDGQNEPTHGSTIKSWRLLLWHEIPKWQQDNEYIVSGYRLVSLHMIATTHTYTAAGQPPGLYGCPLRVYCISTIRLFNAYSHMLGAVVFMILPLYFYNRHFVEEAGAQVQYLLVISIYCLGVAVCFVFSATFHILCNHSCNYAHFCNRLDYLGILVLMWGAGVPTIFYGFFCDSKLRWTYWMTTTSTAVCCTYLTLAPDFASPRFRHWRASLYAGFGLSSIVFVLHGLLIYGWEVQKQRMSLISMGWMAVSNLVGAAIYATRIPERWLPRVFDTFGASHQVFHVAVMIAAWIHFQGLVEAFHLARGMTAGSFRT
ncbi:hypothetical protein M409DRAFT_62526 [Zasmidium cellare ATCC 36951]|uniref:Uncharacterized protein n=1 Tax=Zasmidium cellare ATCC 36951 TaxID=1080233 RepID=A0A6A6D334_ZASCE|nr:uncharacterized protein M409DRAFT_62526 [Zasmidium cellare ATCC 36951]KAF2172858.1 hypothetical protein M409DRAFT_62526 [Zasmidium cellare ATCC 36951]